MKLVKSEIVKTILVFILSFVVIYTILNSQFVLFSNDKNENKKVYYTNLQVGLDSIGKATVATIDPDSNDPVAIVGEPVTTVESSNYISIPKINIKAPIIVPPDNEKQILSSLKKGVVLYPGSSLPGQSGMSVIIGHSSSNFPYTKYSSIFAGLNKLNSGDQIFVNYSGVNYKYTIKNKRIGSSEELASMNFGNDLVLGSCWPVGTNTSRIIITADID